MGTAAANFDGNDGPFYRAEPETSPAQLGFERSRITAANTNKIGFARTTIHQP